MPTVIQPGFVNISSPLDNFGSALAEGAMRGFDLGYAKKQKDQLNKFAVVNDIIAKTFPDELGGFTAAYRSGNPQQAAAADQALGLYLNSIEGISGKRMKAEERAAIKTAFLNGQLTTKQLLANAQSQVMSPGGAPQRPAQEAPQAGASSAGAVNAQGPATPMVSTGTLGNIGEVSKVSNLETLPVGASIPGQPTPIPAGAAQPSTPGTPTNRTTDAARRMAEQATLRGQGYGSAAGGPGATVPPLQAAEPAPPPAPQGGVTIKTPADREVRRKMFEQLLKVEEAKRKGDGKNPFLVGESMQLSAEETKVFQDTYSRELEGKGRAIPTGTGSEIALDNRELTSVAKAVKGTATLMDTLLKARNADELGKKTYSMTRALETASSLVPGSKEMDREWAAGTVKALINATPQELAALGLKEEAQLALQNDSNRIAAEQNSINLFSILKRNAVDLTQLETSKRIAELQYLGSSAAATGTQQGILTKGMTDIAVELIKAAAGSNPGEKLTGLDYAKWLEQAGFKDFADFLRGMFGGEGAVFQPSQGGIPIPLTGARVFATKEKLRPPTPEETTAAGATPGATLGQMSSGLLGGGQPAQGTSRTAQKAAAKASGIDQFFDGGGVQDIYQQNAAKMYADWQAFLASQQ